MDIHCRYENHFEIYRYFSFWLKLKMGSSKNIALEDNNATLTEISPHVKSQERPLPSARSWNFVLFTFFSLQPPLRRRSEPSIVQN